MSKRYDMRSLAPTVCRVLGVRSPGSADAEPLVEVVDSMGEMKRLAVVVIDAFGVSTWMAARLETPTFNAMANRHLLHIRSVMPTITPVNFATMLTGAGPDVHGIRDRTEELKLETIFDVLRENDDASATAARALSSLGILVSPFADHPGIAESNTDDEVTALALEALGKGVDLLWVQLLDVDDAGHMHGPMSPLGIAAVKRADRHLREIAVKTQEEDYGVIVLADHGQHTILKEDGSEGGTHGTYSNEDVFVPLVWGTPQDIRGVLGVST
jgi:predicted AlkP superfamily pyrophosphatase or phosphodiesterase